MTTRQIESRVKKLRDLEAKIAEMQQTADGLKAELKAELESQHLEELETKSGLIRWKFIFSKRFDSKKLKADSPELYEKYTSESITRRFSIA